MKRLLRKRKIIEFANVLHLLFDKQPQGASHFMFNLRRSSLMLLKRYIFSNFHAKSFNFNAFQSGNNFSGEIIFIPSKECEILKALLIR